MAEQRSAAALVLLLALVLSVPAPTTDGPMSTSAALAAPGSPDPLTVEGPVRFSGDDATLLAVDGRRYRGVIELTDSGRVVNDVDIEGYVAGIAEMPSRWPLAALEAQAVAARTYAWWSAEAAVHDGYDICDTVACQVYRGAEVLLDGGERWGAAVEATAGQVLVGDDDRPILARYFSTSGGRTYDAEEVFPATGARDYLVAIDDPYDEVSPYHRWEVPFTRAEFDEILSRGERLAATVPVAAVERTGAVDDVSANFVVRARDGTEVEVGAVELRDFLSRVAVSRFPDRFPTARADGLRPLPSTVPSSRFTVEVTPDAVVLHGRGWGHGVGMGQYGARGRAQAGHDATEILAAYYGGREPVGADDLPQRIRVGLTAPRDEVVIAADDVLRIEADGEVVVARAIGPWTATYEQGRWRLAPPPGGERDLEVAPTRIVEGLTRQGEVIAVEAEVDAHALLRLEVRDSSDALVRSHHLGVVEPGIHTARWRITDDAGAVVAPGRYHVALIGEDAAGDQAGAPVAVELAPEDLPGPTEGEAAGSAAAPTSGTLPLSVIAVALALALLAATLLTIRLARRSSS